MPVIEEHTGMDLLINEVAGNNPTGAGAYSSGQRLQPTNIPGFRQTTNFHPKYAKSSEEKKKKRSISRFFSDMSRLGMSYEEDVLKNLRAIPADKSLMPKEQIQGNAEILQMFANNKWKVKQNADQSIFEKDLPLKRESLRKMAMQPELETILDSMSDSAILYDNALTYFAEPFIEEQELQVFTKETQSKITECMNTNFRRFYKMLDWKYRAWDDFKRWLVEGVLSWEIVWDSLEKPTKIIGLIPVDPATLTRKQESGKYYWVQNAGMTGKERKLLDAQIVYIAYQETNCINRTSYLERLVRPFNIYRIVEQASLIWCIVNSSYKLKFTIPVKGMSQPKGMQTLASAMNRYREDIKFIGDSGELTINGQQNLPFNREFWFPESDAGTPDVQTLGGDGPDMNNLEILTYFRNQLYRASKIPLSRFDQENGETWFGTDATSIAQAEISFGRFLQRLRNKFSQIIIKPLQLQLACEIPELEGNRELLEAVSLKYNSYNMFEELMQLEIMSKRIQHIQEMKDGLVDMLSDGSEYKYFASEFLVRKYLGLSDADLALNAKLKKEEIKNQLETQQDAQAQVQGQEGGQGRGGFGF